MSHAPLIFSLFKQNPQTSLERHDSAGCTSRGHLADMSHVSQQDSPLGRHRRHTETHSEAPFPRSARQVPQTCQFHTFCPQTSEDTDKQRNFGLNPYGDVSASPFQPVGCVELAVEAMHSVDTREIPYNAIFSPREVPCQDRQPFASKMQVVRQVHLIPTHLFTPGIRHFLVGSRNQRETCSIGCGGTSAPTARRATRFSGVSRPCLQPFPLRMPRLKQRV